MCVNSNRVVKDRPVESQQAINSSTTEHPTDTLFTYLLIQSLTFPEWQKKPHLKHPTPSQLFHQPIRVVHLFVANQSVDALKSDQKP